MHRVFTLREGFIGWQSRRWRAQLTSNRSIGSRKKIKLLVNLVAGLRSDQRRAAEDNARLTAEVESLRARVAEAEGTNADLSALRDEREVIRTRVADMLQQLEGI